MVKVSVKTIGLDIVNAKLLMAAPRILEQNRLMVGAMLKEIKPVVIAQTPLGPGHFGYHLRDRFETDVTSEGIRTKGVLKSPPTGYWRECGTLGRFRKSRAAGMASTGGEKAYMTAHHAASLAKRVITQYFGSQTRCWK